MSYVHALFPSLGDKITGQVLRIYNAERSTTNDFTTPFSTTGKSLPTALEVSNYAIGPQQRAANLNSEVTFSCIAYWLADAFSGSGRKAWKYEYSIPPSFHSADLYANGWLSDPTQNIPEDFARALQRTSASTLLEYLPSGL